MGFSMDFAWKIIGFYSSFDGFFSSHVTKGLEIQVFNGFSLRIDEFFDWQLPKLLEIQVFLEFLTRN